MASGRRRDKDASLNEYEEQRLATIAENKRRLEALNIPTLSNMNQHGRTTKRTKVMYIHSLQIGFVHFKTTFYTMFNDCRGFITLVM